MAYADFFATEARGMFSPPNGAEPQVIPDYWRNSREEEPRTDLPELSDEELNALGWKGPIQLDMDSHTHYNVWNRETREWDIFELSQNHKQRNVRYQRFWDELIETSAYSTIKSNASQSLSANLILTEFIALLADAKNKHPNVVRIQQSLLDVLEFASLSDEENVEFESTFREPGMHAIYTLV